ncbi:UNVERIFIED_CONTAM: protein ACTIVITY OF BC1 COMPLEX kinase, chloroplastic [Sesamum calycinum]|uniref:Protein ACTIVITY OF BC1 COMPLEX kinase, chloroplastic n=1 Tax=Sesamum calycinum TaxID=2727403 RepID=A0AAW2SD73_9LAMI
MSTTTLSVPCCVGARISVRRRGRVKAIPPRAALVEAKPRPAQAINGGDGNASVALLRVRDSSSSAPSSRDRADDMQAEARAMARAANASVYSPELLATKYGSRPIKVVRRALEIFAGLGYFAFNLWLDQVKGELDQNQRQRAVQLRKTLTRLGPTFVKIGQGLSTRPDCARLNTWRSFLSCRNGEVLVKRKKYANENLLSIEPCSSIIDSSYNEIVRVLKSANAEAFSCIERELECPLDSIYSSISASPIAAASLGQVYKAQLKYSGQVVAVKVQRPALIDEFARRVYQELNYVQEGQNARRFKKLYADKEDVLVPDIFWDYTSGKVLTMEWVEGVKLNEQEAIERQGLKVLDLVNTGIQCSLRQLLEYGYFHADPHPGNLLATPDGKLAFLDFGMMSETPEQARSAIIGHVVHMVNRDYEAMARDYYALDFLSPSVDVSPIVPALRNFFDDALNSTVSELNFKTIVDVPAYYALILRSLTVLEGLALYADPNFKVLAASYPYFAKRLLTDPNPYLRDALIELLFKDGRFRHVLWTDLFHHYLWNRLENLLVQGKKDSDFNAKDALQPVLKLLLGADGEELRVLVIKEAVRVTEAIILGSVVESYKSIPDVIRTLVFNFSATGPLVMNSAEQESMLELRAQVFRIWELLRSSDNFDPSMLQPILQVLQEPEARNLGGRVVGGITQRLAARLLQQVLRDPPTVSSPTS